MAIVNLEVPFRSMQGSLEEKGIIYRKKQYKDDDGRVIHEGRQEAYAVKRPRDYKKNPPQGAELQHLNLFRQATLMTKEIINSVKPEDAQPQVVIAAHQRPHILTREEAQTLFAEYQVRYKAQLPNTRGTRPDPDAPIDKTTHAPKRYFRLDNFIRSILYHHLASQPSEQQLSAQQTPEQTAPEQPN